MAQSVSFKNFSINFKRSATKPLFGRRDGVRMESSFVFDTITTVFTETNTGFSEGLEAGGIFYRVDQLIYHWGYSGKVGSQHQLDGRFFDGEVSLFSFIIKTIKFCINVSQRWR